MASHSPEVELGDNREAGELRDGVLGSSLDRLDRIRGAYDPDGLFDAAAHRQ